MPSSLEYSRSTVPKLRLTCRDGAPSINWDGAHGSAASHRLDRKATISSVITHYTPMAPTLVRAPFHRPGWVYEEKVDGWRMLAYKERTHVGFVSRNGIDHTRRFQDVATAISKLSARTLVLDAELAIFDEQLRSRFEWLREPDPNAVATPPLLMVFDLVYRDGRDLTARRSVIRAPAWRTSSPGASWCSQCAGSRRTALRRGTKSLNAATRGTWPRTKRARTRAARRGGG